MDIEELIFEIEYFVKLISMRNRYYPDYEWFMDFHHDRIYYMKTILKVDFISGFYVMDDLWVLTDIHANKNA